MPLFHHVRRLLGDPGVVVFECRQCGETLETEADRCDVCGSEGVVRYDIE